MEINNNLAPIALFVYNRLELVQQTILNLQKNYLAKDSDLFIFSDGPKDDEDNIKIINVRNYLKKITGFKSVKIIERDKNIGLANSIISGVTEIANQYEKIIVLEDDMVTSPYFLQYMNESLDFYKDEEKVISIHGYIYPLKGNLPETYFIKGADCWGWATWKRGWNLFEVNGQKLLDELKTKNLIKQFNFDNSYNYDKMLEKQISGQNNSWAIRWYASAFLKNKLTLYPGKTLVTNIGLSGGTHCQGAESYLNTNLSDKKIEINKIAIEENRVARREIKKYFKSLKPGIIDKVKNKIKKYAK
jgi:hypothetical protein